MMIITSCKSCETRNTSGVPSVCWTCTPHEKLLSTPPCTAPADVISNEFGRAQPRHIPCLSCICFDVKIIIVLLIIVLLTILCLLKINNAFQKLPGACHAELSQIRRNVGLNFLVLLIQHYDATNANQTRMVQLPATAAIEYVAAGHFFPGVFCPGALLAGGIFVRGVLCPFPPITMRIRTV